METEKNKKLPLKSFISIIVCVAIVFSYVVFMGKYVRPINEEFDIWDPFYAEEENSIDAVFIGASSIYRYWIPTQGYEEQGFTSYLLTHAGQPFGAIPYVMKEVAKTQDVKLFVVEVRKSFVDDSRRYLGTYEQSNNTYCLSKVTAGMNPSLNRIELINSNLVTDEDDNKFEWIFSFLKYHENLMKLSLSDIKSRVFVKTDKYKSNKQLSVVVPLEYPSRYKENTSVDINDNVKATIDEIQATADSLGAKVLFLATPFVPTKTKYSFMKAAYRYIESKGYDFLDCSLAYDQVGVSLYTDFYNVNHMNIHGATKFTNYLGTYLKSTYGLETTLTKTAKASWDKALEDWDVREAELLSEWQENVNKLYY